MGTKGMTVIVEGDHLVGNRRARHMALPKGDIAIDGDGLRERWGNRFGAIVLVRTKRFTETLVEILNVCDAQNDCDQCPVLLKRACVRKWDKICSNSVDFADKFKRRKGE